MPLLFVLFLKTLNFRLGARFYSWLTLERSNVSSRQDYACTSPTLPLFYVFSQCDSLLLTWPTQHLASGNKLHCHINQACGKPAYHDLCLLQADKSLLLVACSQKRTSLLKKKAAFFLQSYIHNSCICQLFQAELTL